MKQTLLALLAAALVAATLHAEPPLAPPAKLPTTPVEVAALIRTADEARLWHEQLGQRRRQAGRGRAQPRVSEHIAHHDWRRFSLPGPLRLAPGRQRLALSIAPVSGESLEKLELLSIELVRPEVKERLHRAALAMRAKADTQWYREPRYGLMCHWTSQRDLIGELAEALGQRGIRVLFYYHLGSDGITARTPPIQCGCVTSASSNLNLGVESLQFGAGS